MKKYIKYISLLIGIAGIIFGLGLQNKLSLNILLEILIIGILGIYFAIIIQIHEKQSETKELLKYLNMLYKKEDNENILNNQNKEIEILQFIKNKILENYEQVRQSEAINRNIQIEKLEILKINSENQKIIKSEILDSLDRIYKKEDSKIIKNIYEVVKELKKDMCNEYQQENLNRTELQKIIKESTDRLVEIPEILNLLFNNLIEKLDSRLENDKDIIEELAQKVQDMIREIKRNIEELLDEIDHSQNNLFEKIENLSEDYNKFQNFTDATIQKMNMMAENDYKFLEGFLKNNERINK